MIRTIRVRFGLRWKFVAAECGDQHAGSVRSPDAAITLSGVWDLDFGPL